MSIPTRNLLNETPLVFQTPRVDHVDGVVRCQHSDVDIPHSAHKDAVWFDWNHVEVWDCSGLAFGTIDAD